jgi:flagellar biogenesis protein FliO
VLVSSRRTTLVLAMVIAGTCAIARGQDAPDSARASTPAAGTSHAPAAPPASREAQALGSPGKSLLSRDQKPAASKDRPAGWLGSTILPLAGVLALIVFGGTVLRSGARRIGGLRSSLGAGGRSPAGILEILGRYPVGRGMSLVLLKLDSRVLLLSQSAGGRFGAGATFSTLAEISDPEQVASILIKSRDAEGDSLAERFRSMLQRFDREMDVPAAHSGDGVLWDGTRSDIPVIDLTKRPSPRTAPRKRLPKAGAQT